MGAHFSEQDILRSLDMAFREERDEGYPEGDYNLYIFFLDLEHGYCDTASSRIHLFADTARWAIVFETSGYQNRGYNARIDLTYIGNCINYVPKREPHDLPISNVSYVDLISCYEFERLENKDGDENECFELISKDAEYVTVHGQNTPIEKDISKYKALAIFPREDDNPNQLIGFCDLVRYLHEMQPELISATDAEIRHQIPADIPKIMTIDHFHFESRYNEELLPSIQETYQLLAKVLTTRDPSFWKPTQEPNNHWSNWESGGL